MAKNQAKIQFTADTKEFNKQIQKANSTMTVLRSEMKLNETQMKATGETVEGLQKKHDLLADQLKQSESKTEALNGKLEAAIKNFGEGSVEVDKWRTQLLNAQTAQKKLEQAVAQAEAELEDFKAAADDSGDATETLTDKVDRQQTELKQLKKEYVNVIDQYGETSSEAKDLEKRISDLSGELKDNKRAMSDAEDAADKLDKSMEDAGDAARNSGDGFTVAKGAIADLASEAIQLAIGQLSDFIGYLRDLPEATREIRQDMATLETSFETAGLTNEQATETWKELYKVFGEDDRAVEAANLISKMSDNQKDLNDWVTITAGVYGQYQDSLPVEGLAEASNETAKTGQVTGVLADALNWSSEAASMFSKYMSDDVVTAEDAFNEALKECNTEEERQALITETLTSLYGDSAKKFEEASGSQLAAKEAAAELALAEQDLAEKIEPVTTAWDGMKAQLLNAVAPAIEGVCGLLQDAIVWLEEHPVALKAMAAAVGVLAVGLGGLAVAAGIYTVAQWAMNSAILANPITWVIAGVIAAIAALAAIVVVVVSYWDEIKAACLSAWEKVKGVFSSISAWFSTNVINPIKKLFSSLWDGIKTVWNGICNVIEVGIMLIGSIVKAAFNIITIPFRFIWENCKQYVLAAWNWIKVKVTTGVNAVKSVITRVMNSVKSVFSTVWNAIKNVVSTVWNSIKSAVSTASNAVKNVVSKVWNGIKSVTTSVWNNIKSRISSVVNGVKGTVSNVFNSIKNTAQNVWNGVKNAIIKPIEAAKNKVKSLVDTIKGFFSNLKLKLPNIKLPHFKIKGSFSLNPPSVPKLSIDWYKNGGVMMRPTIFGINGNRMMAGGEAGPEAIAPISTLQSYVSEAVERANQMYDLRSLAAAVEDLANRPIELNINGRNFATATASDGDSVNGLRSTFKSRGLVLD